MKAGDWRTERDSPANRSKLSSNNWEDVQPFPPLATAVFVIDALAMVV